MDEHTTFLHKITDSWFQVCVSTAVLEYIGRKVSWKRKDSGNRARQNIIFVELLNFYNTKYTEIAATPLLFFEKYIRWFVKTKWS